jgi:hypothetical protein
MSPAPKYNVIIKVRHKGKEVFLKYKNVTKHKSLWNYVERRFDTVIFYTLYDIVTRNYVESYSKNNPIP